MNNLKRLYRFLKEKGVYAAWKRDLKYSCKKRGYVLKEKLEGLRNLREPLSSSFVYANTPEGHIFWAKIQNEFELFLFKNDNKQPAKENTKGRKKEENSLV